MAEGPDDLESFIAERAQAAPSFPALVEAYLANRELMRALAEQRAELGLSLQAVAAQMGTSPAALAQLERGEGDPKLSTVQRYAVALGQRVDWRLAKQRSSDSSEPTGRSPGSGLMQRAEAEEPPVPARRNR